MKKVILISGKMGSGKDYIASLIEKELSSRNYKVGIIHLADPLKMVCTQLFKWNGQKDEQGRKLLQEMGTEVGQSYNKNLWTDIITNLIGAFSSFFDYILIPDCRFMHELEHNYGYPAFSIRVANRGEKNNRSFHSSETDLDYCTSFNSYFNNSADLTEQQIYDNIITVIERIEKE